MQSKYFPPLIEMVRAYHAFESLTKILFGSKMSVAFVKYFLEENEKMIATATPPV